MFLMNASRLVALQTKWESFGAARNCRYPVCFSDAEGDVTRTSKKQKGEKGTSNRVTSNTTLLQKHPQYTKCGCPADLDDTEVEENVGFGTLLLDSDSDDSVDRADVLSEEYLSDHLGIGKRLQPASPQSISSDDSFEQSIQAEIVQFLNEKKQQESSKCVIGEDKKDSHLQKTSAQPKCLQSKTQEQPSDFRQANQAYLEMATASQPWLAERNEESGANYWGTRGALINESVHASDSSSDDGIEEAIQLYQLEKIRKEAEIHKSRIGSKRKEINSKSTELESTSNEFNKLFKPLKKARHFAPPGNKIAACELTLQASCRADTSAELMCAEAILDISKTIMPSQMGSDSKSLAADSFFSPQLLSSSRCESDSSLVDSDDSIEQEIRAFLALKAQSESLGTKPPSLAHSIQMPLPSEQNSLTSTLEPSLPKTLKLSLSQKRRLKREGRIAKQGASKPPEQRETGLFQPGNHSRFPVLQEGCALSSPAELCDAQRLGSKETRQQQPAASELSGCVALDPVNPFMQVQSSTGKLMKNTIQTQERDGSDDESSSLDSDEDLDSAIKDLLRSKRKLKKKSKDQKSQCKKRVRFSETETQLLDEFSSLQQNEWKCKNPMLLKSCFSKPRKAVKENAIRNPPDNTSVKLTNEKPETVKNLEFNLQLKKGYKPKPISNQNNLRIAKNRKCAFTAASDADDSSSVDSDDSIEQEIRKFLAEKAKDTAGNSEMQKDDVTLDLLSVTKPAANKGKAKQQLVENELDLMLGQGKKTEMSQQTDELKNSQRTEGKSAILHGSGKSASSAENVHTTGRSKAKQGAVEVKGVAGGHCPDSLLKGKLSNMGRCDTEHEVLEDQEVGREGRQLFPYTNHPTTLGVPLAIYYRSRKGSYEKLKVLPRA
ncbi:protein phosphatase 1 regulatory subunit 26 [Patagioenas fasciata monilis]|uniref:Protein phosphatase 1 regulatory subunit 26 n=1 Tax=Patagioenas fasciata monilis TaxID=372326 RepID=A0A1V4J616_PATFA|nr:protein phosphatase 1 regulatory subunit 26 [Patagioenas fasciata monilis]